MINELDSSISFKMDFGPKIIEIQCPKCHQAYHIPETDLNEGMVNCWNEGCGARYMQKAHKTENFSFVRRMLHYCKGEK